MKLEDIGWNAAFAFHLAELGDPSLEPARVSRHDREIYYAIGRRDEFRASLPGRMRHITASISELPAIGDWIAVRLRDDRFVIDAVLPRKSCLSRQAAGLRIEDQVLAANVDAVLVVTGLDVDFNVRRLERYLSLIWESGAFPVIVLNKADLCFDVDAAIRRAEDIAGVADVHAISASRGTGVAALSRYWAPGQTAVLMGSSGVGKSTLINRIFAVDLQRVGPVRENDSRGRHTTTHRELFVLPGGGAIIDTPGLRELQLRGDPDGLGETLPEIVALALHCRFRDCRHESEPGCAVLDGLERNHLAPDRYASFVKMRKELESHQIRQESHKVRAYERRFSKMVRHIKKDDKRRGLRTRSRF